MYTYLYIIYFYYVYYLYCFYVYILYINIYYNNIKLYSFFCNNTRTKNMDLILLYLTYYFYVIFVENSILNSTQSDRKIICSKKDYLEVQILYLGSMYYTHSLVSNVKPVFYTNVSNDGIALNFKVNVICNFLHTTKIKTLV